MKFLNKRVLALVLEKYKITFHNMHNKIQDIPKS